MSRVDWFSLAWLLILVASFFGFWGGIVFLVAS